MFNLKFKTMKKLFFLVSFFALIGAGSSWAQGTAIAPQTGALFTYTATAHSGNSYAWSLTKGATYATATTASADVTVVDASDNAYTFGSSIVDKNSIKITWVSPTISTTDYYFLTVTETGTNSCQNIKSIAIRPVNSFELLFVSAQNATTDNPEGTDYEVCSTSATVIEFEGDLASAANAKQFQYDFGKTYMTYHITAQGIANTKWKAVLTPTIPTDLTGRVTAYFGTYAQATAEGGTTVNSGNALVTATAYDLEVTAGTNEIWVTFVVDNSLTAENTYNNSGFEGSTAATNVTVTLGSGSAAGSTYQYAVTDVNNKTATSDAEMHVIKPRPATAITTP